jgi:TRAP-type C4-dicarboxylate transport system permease small subunit
MDLALKALGIAGRRGGGAPGGVAVRHRVLVSLDVLLRYFLDRPLLFVDELASLLQVLVIFGGLAYTFLVGGHVRVDLVTSHVPPPVRAWLRVVTLVLGLVFVGVVAWVTMQSALTAYRYGRVSAVMLYPLWIPMLLIPIGLLLLGAAMAATLARQCRAVDGPPGTRDEMPPSSGPR